ncbi:MAG: murein biosynthesis integral membrane protein MurJ, partial [Candidatus Omnitrophota bacterium]
MAGNKSIIKSASIISLATLCSRILGFIRDIVIAAFFGTGAVSEAFFVAFRIPNLLRNLIGEGAANSAFVPVFCEYREKEKEDFWNLVSSAFWAILLVLAGIVLLGILFSCPIVGIIAPGFLKEPGKFLLAVRLTRILFPYLLFIGLAAYLMGILHSFKSFAAPAFGSCLLNICMIISIFIASRFMPNPVFGLAIGVLVGGILQIGIQLPSLFRQGFGLSILKTKLNFSHPGLKKISRLLIPRIFGSAVYHLNVLIDTILASFAFIVGQGAVAAIYYANRIVQFPLALFGIALFSAVLPTLSGQAAARDIQALKSTLNFSLRTVYFLMLPAAFGLIVLSGPVIRVLFQRGNFDYYSAQISSSALFFYALGLIFFGGMKILIAGFYSLQDTRTPVKMAALALLVNLALNIILMFPLKVGGLALASSLSAGFNFLLLYRNLGKQIGRIITKDSYIYFLKVTGAGLAMLVFIRLFFYKAAVYLNPVPGLALTIILATLVYFGICLLLKVEMKPRL